MPVAAANAVATPMRRWMRAVAGFFAVFFLSCLSTQALATTLTVTALQLDSAAVEQAGDVLVRQSGEETAQRQILKRGQVLQAGTELTAPRGLQIELTTANSNRITLYPGAKFVAAVITDQGESHMPLLGRIAVDVHKALSFFNLSYDRITAGVKGTVFVVDVEPQKSFGLQVNEGVVEVEQRVRVAIDGDGQRQSVESDNIHLVENIRAGESRAYSLSEEAYFAKFKTYADAEAYFRTALEEARATGDARQIYRAVVNLIEVLIRLGRFGSIAELRETCEESARSAKIVLGDAECLEGQGVATVGQGRLAEGLDVLRRALTLFQTRLQGRDHVLIAVAMSNVASALEKLGEYRQAASHLEMAVLMCNRLRRSSGVSNSVLIGTFQNLGMVYGRLGDHRREAAMLERSVEFYRRIIGGGDDPGLAAAIHNLGSAYYWLGNYGLAKSSYLQSYEMNRRLYGNRDHPATASGLFVLGTVHNATREYPKALSYHQLALEMRQRLSQGQENLEIAASLNNLATTRFALGDIQGAKNSYERSLAMKDRLLAGRDHQDIATGLVGLGTCYQRLGDYPRALDTMKRALEMMGRLTSGRDSEIASGALHNIGVTLALTGDDARAVDALNKAIQMNDRMYRGADHPSTADGLAQLALSQQRLGDQSGAAASRSRAEQMRRRLEGRQAPN